MPLKVRVRAKIQLSFLDYLLQELVVVRGGVQVYQPSLLIYSIIRCIILFNHTTNDIFALRGRAAESEHLGISERLLPAEHFAIL